MRKPHFKNEPNSIRIHFGILTSCILLFLLFVFYLGGRYILVKIIRQAEREITSVSSDIKTSIVKQSAALQQRAVHNANLYAETPADKPPAIFLRQLLASTNQSAPTDLSLLINADGSLREGYYRGEKDTPKPVDQDALARLFPRRNLLSDLMRRNRLPLSGMVRFRNNPCYISVAAVYNADGEARAFLCVGSLVRKNPLHRKMSRLSNGLSVSINEKMVTEETAPEEDQTAELPAPIFKKDRIFAAGSQWYVGSNQFEAIIPIYDIFGREITSLSIQFPRRFASLTTIALTWLTIFVAVVGMIFIAPIFWLQSRVILDPLSKLDQSIRAISESYKKNRVEYLNYSSNDEFGRVARGVDTLLRELNSKSHELMLHDQRQKALISSIPDCLCIFSGGATLVNLKKQPDDVAPIPDLELEKPLSPKFFKKESILNFEKALAKSIKTGKTTNAQLSCHATNKVERRFETRVTRMNANLVLVVFRDVTKETLAREEREKIKARDGKAQHMSTLSNFAAGIAHDFNNILTIIDNTLEGWLGNDELKGQNARDAIATIQETSQRGGDLVRELRTYAGQTSTNMQRKNPVEIITKLTPLYSGVIDPSVNIETTHGNNLDDVMVDSGQFWKVIVNLAKNAAEALKNSHGRIKISTYNYNLTKTKALNFMSGHPLEPGNGVIFEVADNGPGIARDNIDRLFEPFFSTKAVSRGLGLPTAFGIVNSHNGGIRIVSHQNSGSKFQVWLPTAEETQAPGEPEESTRKTVGAVATKASAATESTRPRHSPPCVLIIDDDPAIVRTTELLLNRMGVETLAAKSKTEAAARFKKHQNKIDLVLMDAQIGNLDSMRLLTTLRIIRKNLPVLICSGYSKERIKRMFTGSHINGILTKPYTLAELREILSKFIKISDNFLN